MRDEVKKKSKLWKWIRVTLYLLLVSIVAIVAIGYFLLWLLFFRSDDELVDSWTMKKSLGVETQHQPMTRAEFKDFELKRDSMARRINSEIRAIISRMAYIPKG